MSKTLSYFRNTLFLSAAALSATSLPQAAQAQTDGASAGLETITVIARRRAENLQDVPVAVSAFTADDLQQLQANELSALQGAVPNLNVVQGRGSNSSANIFIRGIGQPDALQTFDPAVGIYVDGVYISRIQGALFSLFDVERIEVLRGPQGSLYGKNTIGGAINIVSKKPEDDITARAELTYGRFDQILANGYVGGALQEGKWWASLAASYEKRDGIVTDPLTQQRYNDDNNLAMRGIIRGEPTDNLRVTLSADWATQDNAPTLGRDESPLNQTDFALGTVVLNPAPVGEFDFMTSTSLSPDQGQELDHWGVSLRGELDVSDAITLVSISAYRELDSDAFIDIDASEFEIGDVFVGIDQHQFSQELQLQYDSGPLKGVFGLYYLNENVASSQAAFADDLFAFAGLPADFLRTIGDDLELDSFAVFGQGTYDINDAFSLTVGMRYTYEEKKYFRTTTTQSAFFATTPAFNSTFAFNNEEDFSAFTPSVTLDYKATDDVLLYASVSRGFKSGGFNGRANSAADVSAFEPEKVWTYEAGFKSTLVNNKVRLNGAIFYNDYTDFQARVGGATVGEFPVINAGELEIYGAELELVAQPVDGWTLTGSLGYLEADYKEFNDTRTPGCSPDTCEPAFAPELNMRLASNYRHQLPDEYGSVSFLGEVRHVSSHQLSVDNFLPNFPLEEDGYTLINALVTWSSVDDRYYLRAGVKNLTDEVYRTDGQEFSNVGNIQTAYYGDPRTYSITLGFNF